MIHGRKLIVVPVTLIVVFCNTCVTLELSIPNVLRPFCVTLLVMAPVAVNVALPVPKLVTDVTLAPLKVMVVELLASYHRYGLTVRSFGFQGLSPPRLRPILPLNADIRQIL
jgi:hypothetical protein